MKLAGSVRLRPVRLGFLVEPNDLTQLRRIMRLCCCLWGGRYNPIIPFFEETPPRWTAPFERLGGLDIARAYIDFFEPDVLVEASEGMAAKLGWPKIRLAFDLPRIITLSDFYKLNARNRIEFAGGIDIYNCYNRSLRQRI
jgi:hypothetical protein